MGQRPHSRWAARLAAAAAMAALLVGLPAALITFVGWPLPHTLPTIDVVRAWLSSPIGDQAVINILALLAWYLWAQFTRSVVVETMAAARGVHAPRLRMAAGTQHLAAALVTTLSLSVVATAVAAPALSTVRAAPPPTAATVPSGQMPTPAAVTAAVFNGRAMQTHESMPSLSTVELRTVGYMSIVAGGVHYDCEVHRGDNLSHIAAQWLGDADRWPEIYALNRGKHWPAVSGDTRLSDPNLIFPGWVLDMPADARPPAGVVSAQHNATSDQPSTPRPQTQPAPATATTQPSPSPGTTTPPPTPSYESAATPPTIVAVPTDDGVAAHASPEPTASATEDQRKDPPQAPSADRRSWPAGISLAEFLWIDAGLVAAVLAARRLVLALRRRRYKPRPPSATVRLGGPDTAPMPAVLGQITRALANLEEHDHDNTESDDAGNGVAAPHLGLGDLRMAGPPVTPALTNPVLDMWPSSGLGLCGPGAESAARGFITAALAVGGAEHPDARSRVIIPGATLATLLGVAVVNIAETPRLEVTADLAEALEELEEETLHRTRIVYDHEVDNVAAVREADPREEPLPPLVLIADATAAHERARIAAVLAQGQRLDIHGIMLGDWPDGDTILVAEDGTTSRADADRVRHGAHPADLGRLAVLGPADTASLIALLAESHTGQPPLHPWPGQPHAHPDRAPANDAVPAVDEQKADTHPPGDVEADVAETDDEVLPDEGSDEGTEADGATAPAFHAQQPATHTETTPPSTDADNVTDGDCGDDGDPGGPAAVPRQAVVKVLGRPWLDDTDATPGDPLRGRALELLVYLAVHEHGVTHDAVLDDVMANVASSKAPHLLDSAVYNLRQTLKRCAGPGKYVLRTRKGRFILNRDLFDIDLWRMRQALSEYETSVERTVRVAALRRAVAEYTGDLAEDCAYEWVESLRQGVANEAIDAVVALAEALADEDPEQALSVLDNARAHSPTVEELYTTAMRIHARHDNPDGVKAAMRAMQRALSDINTDPTDDSLAVYEQLTSPRGRPRGPQP